MVQGESGEGGAERAVPGVKRERERQDDGQRTRLGTATEQARSDTVGKRWNRRCQVAAHRQRVSELRRACWHSKLPPDADGAMGWSIHSPIHAHIHPPIHAHIHPPIHRTLHGARH
eukprot:358382-Chlamydomonas_euryale.AAC.2